MSNHLTIATPNNYQMQKLLFLMLALTCQSAYSMSATAAKLARQCCGRVQQLNELTVARQPHVNRVAVGRSYLKKRYPACFNRLHAYPELSLAKTAETWAEAAIVDRVREAELELLKYDIAILKQRAEIAKCQRRPDCCLRVYVTDDKAKAAGSAHVTPDRITSDKEVSGC